MKREPIRVLHLLHSMNRGGAETMLMNYYRQMDREQVQFDFLLTYQGISDYEKEILELGGKVFHITPCTLHTFGQYKKDIANFLTVHPQYRIVHSHNSSKSAIPLGIAKKCGVPIRISHSHNMFLANPFSPKECMRKLLRNPLKKVSTHNFACSKEAGIWLYGEKYWKEGKVKIVKNAIDLECFAYMPETRERMRQQFGLKDSYVVGHVGRFAPQKNHDFLIDIFAEIKKKKKEAVLLLVGEGELRSEIEEKVRHLGLSDSVIFTGVRKDVPELMQMMDVFVMPSLFEGLGIVLIEAQTTGLPCFASEGVVAQEAKVTELLNFYSLEHKAEEWATEILKKSVLYTRTSRVGQVTKKGYDSKEAAKKLQEFYIRAYRESECKQEGRK